MFPEKPKRQSKSRFINVRWLLIAILALPLPMTIYFNRRVDTSQFVDMLLIGFMLCCTLYIVYQAVVWLLSGGRAQMSEDTNIEQS